MIHVSEKAAEKIRELLTKEGVPADSGGLRVGVGRHDGLYMPRGQIQNDRANFDHGRGQSQQLPAQRHAVKRDGDVVTAASGVHLAGHIATGALQKIFDKEEQILGGAVVACPCDFRSVKLIQGRAKRLLFRTGKDALVSQHAAVSVVDLEQRVQKISLGVFEIWPENGLGIKRRWKRVGIH